MSGYGYNTYSTYSGMEPRNDSDGWTKPSSDHVCRPVIIDAEGRKQPIIRYIVTTPTPHNAAGSYVTKTETFVERVHSPTHYTGQYSSSPTMEVSPPVDPYEFNKQQGQSLRGANHNRPQKVEEFITKHYTGQYSNSPTTGVSPPVDPYEFNKQQGQSLRGADHNRPQKVEEFITKVQTETYDKPTRTSPFSTTTYRRPTGTAYNTTTGHGDSNDYNNNINNGVHNGQYYQRDEPNRARYWSTLPSEVIERTTTTQLTKPTSDIGSAIEYLKETAITAKPFLGNNGTTTTTTTVSAANVTKPRFTLGMPRRSDYASPTRTTSMETISSSEAKKKYGNAPSLPSPTRERENYGSTIDSREAMRRYSGRIV